MKITESRGFRDITLFCSGELDDASSGYMQSEILRALKVNKNLVLDFAQIESVKPEGMRVLADGGRRAAGMRGTYKIINVNAKVKNKMQAEGLGRYLPS